jgi:hypothetical protein
MPAVTQQIPNFLGGVSRQTDDKKLINQLTDCVNGYPDPTSGLLKRPGMKHTNVLKKADGTAFTKTELAGAAWFFLDRDEAGSYIGCIKGSNIYVWTKEDGTFCTITNNGSSYLTGTQQSDYHFLSVQDVTVVTNKTVSTAMQAVPSASNVSIIGTVKLNSLTAGLKYSVTIQGDKSEVTTTSTTTFEEMLKFVDSMSEIDTGAHLIDKIQADLNAKVGSDSDFSGKWYIQSFDNSFIIRRTTESPSAVVMNQAPPSGATLQSFTLEAAGGLSNTGISAFLDEVTSTTELTTQDTNNHFVKVLNTSSADDDYYLKFQTFDDTADSGPGFWKETVSVNVSPGFNAATMPHQLVNTGATTFEFKQVPWSSRLVGDDNSNSPPSFITVDSTTSPPTYTGKKLTSTFFYNNRFGILSEDNVIFGVANDSFNFFVKSALTQVDSDPIDLSVASIRPVVLTDVLPSPQGLLLFSARQQFQVYSASTTTMTPSTTVIRTISSYEMDTNLSPVDVGTSTAFVNTLPGYSKLFTLSLRDIEQPPIVVDISKPVLEWIPDTIDSLSVSAQNSVILLTDRDSSYLYLYRFYNNGQEDLFQAWTKWQIASTIQAAKIVDDDVIVVSQYEDEYALGSISLDELPTENVYSTTTSFVGNPCLDMATRPASPGGSVSSVVYDTANDITKIYVPYTPITGIDGTMVLTIPNADKGTDSEIDSDSGYYATAIKRVEPVTGYDYFEVKGNFTDYSDGIIVGYDYDYEVTLPKFYYRPDTNKTDFTSILTVSRVKFSVGRTGAVEFKSKADGSSEWKSIQNTIDADSYNADTNPIQKERIFTVPIHQRNTNFELKVTSKFPYPVSLVSMMWEGNYSPRFYRRS